MPWTQERKNRLKYYGLMAIYSPAIIVVLPWVLLTSKRYNKREHERRARRQRPKPSPPPPEAPLRPLPVIRARRLTDAESNHLQLQSALIARIPVEIRLLIWEHLLGPETDGDVLHLDLVGGSLGHVRCYESKPCQKLGHDHHCWGVISQPGWRTNVERKDAERKLQSILLTCKLIYRETVGILYQSNTFDMRSSDTIYRLPRVILPQRFQQIRRIRFSTTFKYFSRFTDDDIGELFAKSELRPTHDAPTWHAACQVLSSMKNLQDVEISITFWNWSGTPEFPPQDKLITSTLRPLRAVRARKYSVVVAESLIGRAQRLLGSQPFQLVPCERPAHLFD